VPATAQTSGARELRCAWCAAPLGSARERLPGRSRCAACGAATTDPWPDEAALEAAYAGWYRPEGGRFAGVGDALLRRTRGRLARRLDDICPPGRVLDVGAGDGALLDGLRVVGREAVGLERTSARPDVIAAEIEDVEGDFAGVVMWHSLEHLRRPGAALRDAAGLLAPGGVLVLALPNADSLQAHAFGDRWLALDLPRHLVHLGAGSLLARLDELDLAVERVSYVRGGQVAFGWLHGLVDRALGGASLYDALRRPQARAEPLGRARRGAILAAAVVLAPLALGATAVEVALRRGGSVYVEARRG
jgi:SAM-dependent methyltransferase